MKYLSKKGYQVYLIWYTKILDKKSLLTFDETSLGEIICAMQQNYKIDGIFKIVNPNYDDKNFAEYPI